MTKYTTEDFERFLFDEGATDALNWYVTASELRKAAKVVFEAIDPKRRDYVVVPGYPRGTPGVGALGPYLLLCAFGLENLIKAILVHRKMAPIEKDKHGRRRLNRKITTHALVDLAKEAGIALTADETALLTLLSNASTVFGRYPSPTVEGAKEGHAPTSSVLGVKTNEAVQAMFEKCLDAFASAFVTIGDPSLVGSAPPT